MALPRDVRLLFIGLWNFADDAGRFRWSARAIKAQVFPGDFDLTEAIIETWLSQLVQGGLLVQYRNGPGTFAYVSGWKHQKISHPQPPKYPDPDDKESFRVDSVNGPGTFLVQTSLIGSDLIGSDLSDRASATPQVPLASVAAESVPDNSQQDRRREPTSVHVSTFEAVFATEAFRRDVKPTPTLTRDQTRRFAKRAIEHAFDAKLDFEAGAAALVRQAFDDAETLDCKVFFTLSECTPGKPAKPRSKSGVPPSAPEKVVYSPRRTDFK